ncbi:phosphoglycerate kinase [Candidatus Uhrbacteria bacterium]|nr:phosphoglycerate kinase [Candidatus Uhrbacteria bacterium]
MKLPLLSTSKSLQGKRVFLRVDWNVPLDAGFDAVDSLKLSRSIATVNMLKERGAIVLIATHLGRPQGRDLKLSTKRLLTLLSLGHGLEVGHLPYALDAERGLSRVSSIVSNALPGTVFLLENVRFNKGEEKNDKKLAKAYASLADLYVNDAFASAHRSHASVVGVASLLPHFAGQNLSDEVKALEKLIEKPKKPFVAFIGGAKITTKIEVIQSLLQIADHVCIGGAMAHAFFVAQKREIGKSFVEKEGVVVAKTLLKNKKIHLPVDVTVTKKIEDGAIARVVPVSGVLKSEMIGDIGPKTMQDWSELIAQAKTVVWNGPMGVAEIPVFSHGSLVIGRAIAARSKGKTYGVVGGGDTLPIAIATGMSEWFDYLSTGGGAMLEFIAAKGKLPGLVCLLK